MSFDDDFKQFERLQGRRTNFEWLWQRVADYVVPRRGDFTVSRFPGQRRDYNIYDSTAEWALEQLAAGLHTLLTSQALPWFYLRVPGFENNQTVNAWLQDVQGRINAVFNDPRSRFQSQIHELYTDLGAFGTAVMDVTFDKWVRFTTRFLGECFIEQTHHGEIDTLFRAFVLTKVRAESVFGPIAALDKIKDPYTPIKFLHAVVPDGNGWASRYWAIDQKAEVSSGRFAEFPYIVPRWAKSSVEDYGRSPAMRCLGDILMVNEQKRTILRAAHKAVSPPLLVPDQGFMQPINLKPDAVNYYDTSMVGEIKYLESKSRYDIGESSLKTTQEAIIRAFYVDMLQLPGGMMPGAQNQNTYMTATEAMIRRENAMRVMGPVVARLQNELLNPLVVKVFGILRRQRSLAPAPEVVQDKPITIEYISPLAVAQEGAEVDKWTRFWQQIQPVAAVDPEVLDSIDLAQLPPWLAGRYHLDHRFIRTPQQVEQIQKQRQEKQEAEQGQITENTNLMAAKRNNEAMGALTKLVGRQAA